MAVTTIDTTDNLTRKRWSKELFTVVQQGFEFPSLVGSSDSAPIQLKTELVKGMGDEITFGIRLDLEGTATVGRDSLVGKAEQMRFRDFKLAIDKIRKSVDIGQDIDVQRVPYDLMKQGKDGMQDWWKRFLNEYIFHHLCGNSQMVSEFAKLGGKSFGVVPVEPDTNHLLSVGGGAETALTSGDKLTLSFLDGVKQRAETPVGGSNNFRVRPIVVNGRNFYRVILHKFVFDQLRTNINPGEWGDMLRAAQKFGDPRVEFEYNGLLVSKSEDIYTRENTTDYSVSSGILTKVYRNILLGAQSAVWGWGGAGDSKSTVMSFNVEKLDHGARTEVSGGGIFGVKKTRFIKNTTGEDHGDYGIITFLSAAGPLAS
jgi:N4-gp56 family major capsid protein